MFTYDLASSDPMIVQISQVRLEIGDTVEDEGVRPDGGNISDEELTVLLVRESTVLGAAAAALELLTRWWRRSADITMGPRSEKLSQVAAGFASDAARMRDRITADTAATDVGYVGVVRLGWQEPCVSEWQA